MHRTTRTLLKYASGTSEQIIAVNLDIRGFSEFSQKVESPDAAMFIKRVYIKLIDTYFSKKISFFKPTGDGLLLIIPYSEKNLQKVATNTVDICLRVLKDFGSFCSNDPMINFDVPRRIGIGISRGTACRLISKNKTLDYSGRVLNLASRLMDLARPTGIVFDKDFVIELLTDEQSKLFAKESVFIKGIAEREPIEIWYIKDSTVISPLSKQPLEKTKWATDIYQWTLKNILNHGPRFSYYLKKEPVDTKQIKIKIKFPLILRGRKQKWYESTLEFPNFEYVFEAGRPRVIIEFDALAKRLQSAGVKNPWPVALEILYPEN